MYNTKFKNLIIIFLLLPVLGLHIPTAYFMGCPMMEDSQKMACCNHEAAQVAKGEQISAKCCCEISKAESPPPPTTYLPQQNEVFQKGEKFNQFETGLCNFHPEIDFSHPSRLEISPQNKLKLETKIYTFVSSYLI